MTRRFVLYVLSSTLSAMAPRGAMAQPVDLFDCIDDGGIGDACSDISVGDYLDCGGWYESFRGRLAWHPLRFVAPITIEVQAHTSPGTRFPLYLEFFTLTGRDPSLGYCDGPGRVLAVIPGRDDCGADVYGPFDLASFGVGLEERYVVRVHFVGDVRGSIQSPFLRCIRVEPVTSARFTIAWGRVKRLYQ